MLSFRALMAGGAVNFIKSVQVVEIVFGAPDTSETATITAVDTTRTVILYDGVRVVSNTSTENVASTIELTDSTTVTATRFSNGGGSTTVRATVVEFYGVVIDSVQTGTITLSSATSNTATISSVDTSRSIAISLGQTSTVNTVDRAFCAVALTNSTTVTATKGDGDDSATVRYLVIQFRAGVVTSVQQASITITSGAGTSQTATITGVNTARTKLFFQGHTIGGSRNPDILYPLVYLSSSTQLTAERNTSDTESTIVRVAVVEFAAHVIKSIQRGRDTIAASTTIKDVTISSVNTAKAMVSYLGFTTTSTSHSEHVYFSSVKLHNNTTVRLERGVSSSETVKVSWEVMEFK